MTQDDPLAARLVKLTTPRGTIALRGDCPLLVLTGSGRHIRVHAASVLIGDTVYPSTPLATTVLDVDEEPICPNHPACTGGDCAHLRQSV